jgi:hypothetical protein
VRIPSISIIYLTDIQNYTVARPFYSVITIEIVSPSISIEKMETKIIEYFTEDVQMV